MLCNCMFEGCFLPRWPYQTEPVTVTKLMFTFIFLMIFSKLKYKFYTWNVQQKIKDKKCTVWQYFGGQSHGLYLMATSRNYSHLQSQLTWWTELSLQERWGEPPPRLFPCNLRYHGWTWNMVLITRPFLCGDGVGGRSQVGMMQVWPCVCGPTNGTLKWGENVFWHVRRHAMWETETQRLFLLCNNVNLVVGNVWFGKKNPLSQQACTRCFFIHK